MRFDDGGQHIQLITDVGILDPFELPFKIPELPVLLRR